MSGIDGSAVRGLSNAKLEALVEMMFLAASADGEFSAVDSGSRLVELIQVADGDRYSLDAAASFAHVGIGSYLQRDEISPALEQTCNELREFIEQRGRSQVGEKPANRT